MFTAEQREQVRAWLVALARSDPRVTGGALIGSLALPNAERRARNAERRSAPGQQVPSFPNSALRVPTSRGPAALLDDWTAAVRQEWGLMHYWDLPFRTSLYRVFLLPSGLEADVSATPAPDFGARGPRFRQLFGATQAGEPTPPPDAQDLIGRGWHHVLHAHAALERGQPCRTRNGERGTRNRVMIPASKPHNFPLPRSAFPLRAALACVRRGIANAECGMQNAESPQS